MNLRRDAMWLAGALLFGTLVLPWVVYVVGVKVLGPYANGGSRRFFADYVADLAHFEWYAWSLALGPMVVILVWRVLGHVGSSSSAG